MRLVRDPGSVRRLLLLCGGLGHGVHWKGECAMRWCAVPAMLLILGCWNGGAGRISVSGQIEGVSVGAGSRVGGRVSEVLVDEGAGVARGEVLVRLEEDEARAMYDAACAKLAQVEAVLAKAIAGPREEEIRRQEAALAQAEAQYLMAVRGFRSEEVEQARAKSEAARAVRDQAQLDLERARSLVAGGAVSKQQFDEAEHRYKSVENEYKASLDQLNLLLHGTRDEQIAMAKADADRARAVLDEMRNGTRAEDIDAARAARDAAAAEKARAEVTLKEMVVVSPQNGVVELIDVHPGDLVRPGPVLTVVDPEDLSVIVYVSALYLGHLRLNQDVTLTSDSHGSEAFTGRITYLSPVGEYTPRNLQTQEERVQQVFGVKIQFDSAGGKLKPGMTVTAHFHFAGAKA
ncbi:MAG: hypothetical protein AMXMBFR4_31290 [Candidatus Hydrogenedentota bacterium]